MILIRLGTIKRTKNCSVKIQKKWDVLSKKRREVVAGKPAKLKAVVMQELKSDFRSSFNDYAVTRLLSADLEADTDGIGKPVGGYAGTPGLLLKSIF